MTSSRNFAFALLLLAAPLTVACSATGSDDAVDGTDALTTASSQDIAQAQAMDVGELQFDLLTPTSERS